MSKKITLNMKKVNMKRTLAWSFMLLLMFSFVGCGIKEKIEKKAGEVLTEKIMEDSGLEDVDIDGDTIKITGEDGEEVVFGSTEWPTSDLVKNVPEFKNGNVIAVMESKDSAMISLDQVDEEYFIDYLDEIKEDYTVDPYEITSEDNITYFASNNEGIGVQIYYLDETLSITISNTPQ